MVLEKIEHTFFAQKLFPENLVVYEIIIIIIRHEVGLDRPVSPSFNSVFKGLPSRRPLGL